MLYEVITKMGYLFVVPFAVTFLIFSVYPVFRTLFLSFTDFKGFGDPNFVGADNYTRVVGDKFFWRALGNTIRIWSVNIILQLGLAFLLTIVFSDMKYRLRGLGIYRAVYYLPNIIAATSVAFVITSYSIHYTKLYEMAGTLQTLPVWLSRLLHRLPKALPCRDAVC